jgi:pimeloyl-ACP methyl ester carboxylesterase
MMLHGLEGSPNGAKIRTVQGLGQYRVLVPDYRPQRETIEQSYERCVLDVIELLKAAPQPDLIIGSSFGGAVLLKLANDGYWMGPSILLAQAGLLYDESLCLPITLPALLIHGTSDTIVPFEHSVRMVTSANQAELLLVNDGHGLGSILGANGVLKWAIERMLC